MGLGDSLVCLGSQIWDRRGFLLNGGRTMQELLGIGWVLLGLVAWFLLCQAFNKALDWLFGKWDINGKDD